MSSIRGVSCCSKLMLFLIFALHGQILFAQSIQKEVSLNDSLKGFMVYEVRIDKQDTIKHGSFSLEASHKDELTGQIQSIAYDGSFNKGRKDGAWLYRNATVRKVGKARLRDYVVEQPIEGKEWIISGHFKAGEADGKWISVSRRIVDGRPSDTLQLIEANFEKGYLVGSLRGRDTLLRFSGSFSGEGRIDGEWRFDKIGSKPSLYEVRKYDDAVFMSHYAMHDQVRTKFEHPGLFNSADKDDARWDELPLSSDIFEVFYETKLFLKGSVGAAAPELGKLVRASNRIMTNALFAFGRRNGHDLWALIGGSEPIDFPKTRVRVFPYSAQEDSALAKGMEAWDWVKVKHQEFISDPVVNVGRYAYADVAFAYELMDLYKGAADTLGAVLSLFQNKAYTYIDRQKLLGFIGPKLQFPDSVSYEYKDNILSRVWQFPWVGNMHFLTVEDIGIQLGYVKSHLENILKNVDITLEDYKRETLLAELETNLVARRDSVISWFSGEDRKEDFNVFHAAIADKILDFTTESFKNYARLEPVEKTEHADDVLNCFGDLLFLYEEARKQPLRVSSLKTEYTRTIWNAYTFTYMDEIVKERLYRAYENELLPAISKDIRDNLDCQNVRLKAQNFASLYKRMLELRETDTKTGERQLRKGSSVSSIIDIFEFDLNLSNQ